MNNAKKALIAGFSAIAIGCGAAQFAAPAASASAEENKPVYETTFTVGGWVQFYDTAKRSYLDQVEDLARDGMNLIDLPLSVSGSLNHSVYNNDITQFYKDLDELCQQIDMYYFYMENYNGLGFQKAWETVQYLSENCLGYHLKDEPSSAQMDALAELCRSFKEGDPTRMPYVNLFPNYAGATNLGGTYRDYVTKWVTLNGGADLDWLYFDHYPFTAFEDVRSTYFSDLEVIRDVAYKNGKIKTGGFTQMGSWNGMRRPTPEMARWSVNSLVTYGLKSISHFCWVAPKYVAPENGGEGMRDFVLTSEGEKTDLYEPMTILNWQTRQLGDVLMKIDVKHAYHTGKAPSGTESLPSGFILQPGSNADNFVYSIAYDKVTDEPYLIVFNKALSGSAKEYTFSVDLGTGIRNMRYYKPTDYTMETLPDPHDLEHTLLAPEEIVYDVSSGTFTDTFLPGEMKIYKPEGDGENGVTIFEELAVPESTHKSGVYVGEQSVALMTGDSGAEIWYTVDGSFPEPDGATSKLYTGPFTVGKFGETAAYTVRAISVRGSEVSKPLDVDLIITDASRNVASGITGKLVSLDGAREIGWSGFNGSASNIKNITDNSFDPTGSVISTDELGWAVIDLGEEQKISKIVYSMWHDWWFSDVKVQVATKEDFSDAETVFESSSMQNVASGGSVISFEPKTVRFIRATNNAKGEGKTSIFTELQAFSAYDSGEDLISDTTGWTALKNGVFTNDGKTITETTPYQTDNWDKAYSYDTKKFKNFMLDVNMSIDVSDPGAWGFAGVQIFREDTEAVQSSQGRGVTVGIEPRGRVLLWDGGSEISARDANIVGWTAGKTFDMKLVVYNGTIAVAVDGRPVLTDYFAEFSGKSGYISIHSGLLPITVNSFSVTELGSDFTFPVKGQAVAETEIARVAVERYLSESTVIGMLGDKVTVIDTAGNRYEVGVTWQGIDYDRSKTGNFDFVGTLSKEDLANSGLSNAYNVKANGSVFIKSEIDRSVVENLLSVAKSLNDYEYTEASWANLQLKVSAAEDILENEFLVQSDVNVGMFQLYDAIYRDLVYAGSTDELTAAIERAEAIDEKDYTAYSYADFAKVLAEAKTYAEGSFKTFAGVKEQVSALAKAESKLVAVGSSETMSDRTAPTIDNVDENGGGCGSSVGSGMAAGAVLLAAAAVAVSKKKED